jgi:hypothetical protein
MQRYSAGVFSPNIDTMQVPDPLGLSPFSIAYSYALPGLDSG